MATWEPVGAPGAPGHRQALAEFLSQALPAGAGALDILRLSHAFGIFGYGVVLSFSTM